MSEPQVQSSSPPPQPRHPVRQTLAEWVSLAVSGLLLLSLASYLVVQAVRTDPPDVPIGILLDHDGTHQFDQRFYLPIRVENEGTRSVRDLKIRVTYTSPDTAQPEEGEIEIDYLGEGASQEIYWIFSDDPRTLNVRAETTQYRLD